MVIARLAMYRNIVYNDMQLRFAIDPQDEDAIITSWIVYGIEVSIAIASGAKGPAKPAVLQQFGRAIATNDYHPSQP